MKSGNVMKKNKINTHQEDLGGEGTIQTAKQQEKLPEEKMRHQV